MAGKGRIIELSTFQTYGKPEIAGYCLRFAAQAKLCLQKGLLNFLPSVENLSLFSIFSVQLYPLLCTAKKY